MNIIKRKPFSPGEILLEEFMQPYKLTQNELARRLYITRRRVNEIINGKRSITPDTALRLGKLFRMSPDYWLNLQIKLDIWNEAHDKKLLQQIKSIKSLGRLKNISHDPKFG